MIIGINCCHLSTKTDGAKTRLVNFYSIVVKKKKNSKFIFFVPKNLNLLDFRKNFNSPNVYFHVVNINSYHVIKRFLLGIFFWPITFRKYNLDYFDQSYLPLIIPFKGKTKVVLTIHDLRYLYFSIDFFYRYIIFKPIVLIGILFSDILITVSKHIKNELNKITNKKVIVLSNFINIKKNSFNNNKFFLRKKYIFSIGHSEKRKNIENLIKAFMYIKLEGYNGHLIICTNQGVNFNKIKRLALNNPYSDCIHILKNQNNKSVNLYYKKCDVFVLPSIYEGFGIPILEAAYHKKPIVLSSIPVFKEISFNKLCYFDPYSPQKIAQKIQEILFDKNKKNRLKKITVEISKHYSSHKIINKFIKIFA